jgi:hypothetical protein
VVPSLPGPVWAQKKDIQRSPLVSDARHRPRKRYPIASYQYRRIGFSHEGTVERDGGPSLAFTLLSKPYGTPAPDKAPVVRF